MRLRPTCARESGGAPGGHGAVNQKGSRAEIDTENGKEEARGDDDGGKVRGCSVSADPGTRETQRRNQEHESNF